jgi:hypothetical protein
MHDLILVLAGGGVVAAILKFIEFLINHSTHKQERAEDKEENDIKEEMKEHLTNVNAQWKVDYCDVNAKAIKSLADEMREGLEAREEKGLERYEEHKEAIGELREALITLTNNTTEITQMGKYMGQSLMALTHDKLTHLGKQYQKRGAITLAEKNNLKLLYTPYHDGLGGNSDGEGYYTYCMNLPVVTDEEALEMDKKLRELDKK